ncbi:hypothetical protein V7024_16735 [Bacillus sp. JJ864]|uniref:hypothetical protein n=1 Tax=Bacillus sp. JJ864 TaxID=3122975 RepID=UPI002FFE259C
MEWKLYEDYKIQGVKALEFVESYAQKVRDAKEGVTAAVAAYEDTLNREFSGESIGAKKAKALENIEKANAALEVAEKEASKAYDYAAKELQDEVTLDDLANDWFGNINPMLQKERVQPIVERAHNGLQEYYSALVDFYKLNDEFGGLIAELNQLGRGLKGAIPSFSDVFALRDMPKPSDTDLMYVQRTKELPEEFRKEEKTN